MGHIAVLVPPELINDAQAARPVVGQYADYYLRFSEVPPSHGDELTATFTVHAEPVGVGTPIQSKHYPDRPLLYPTHLTAEGWGATWLAPRPVHGETRVHGLLMADFGATVARHLRARGTIVRVRSVTDTIDTSSPDQTAWRAIPERHVLQDVSPAPAADPDVSGTMSTSARRWTAASTQAGPTKTEYTGMLVELDLDMSVPTRQ